MIEFNNQDVLDANFTTDEKKGYVIIDLRIRALAFLLDYSLLTAAIYYSYQFMGVFSLSLLDDAIYVLTGFYSLVFILIEHRYDGSIFKKLLKIKNVSSDGKKLGLHIFAIKLVLRPIAFCITLIYLKLCFAILLWLFGIHKLLFRFIEGEIFVLWYDYSINQMTVKVD